MELITLKVSTAVLVTVSEASAPLSHSSYYRSGNMSFPEICISMHHAIPKHVGAVDTQKVLGKNLACIMYFYFIIGKKKSN